MGGGGGMEELTEDEERALRAQRKQIRSTCFSSFLLSLSAAQVLFFTLYGFFLLFNLKFRLCYVLCLYRLAHPGGPLKTNKAAALAKFLERKLQDPNGLSSIDPPLLRVSTTLRQDSLMITSFLKALVSIECEGLIFYDTLLISGGTSISGRRIQHVASFEDVEQITVDEDAKLTRPNKKLKL
ncbi:hypothetical protein HID58_090182 [Brassica napus]|uniref:Uncharacterized protein n=1 Tax=Brassica napus TaxID=3708 RepID=A0ABQ7XG13_BRANA|nr:hypothetical protein HID58_090182 [Brassica napus]